MLCHLVTNSMTVFDRDRWLALEPLLDQVLDIPPGERGRWLEELSHGSPIVAADLAALLAGEDAADQSGFLAAPLDVSLAGLQLGAYRLERPLGQGGMGTVWLAFRADGRFEGKAAVKILNLALLSSTGQERFRREGSLLARLAHPGIARLLDAGLGGAGQPYLVLEYVEGLPIDDFAGQCQLPEADRIRLVLQVLAAVGHAHAHLIVHRDLKPSNILVTPEGVVKLLDFGIAKLLDEGGGDRSALTLDGGRLLTPKYAAPEQVRGDPLTTAADVYSLGVLLYLLLSGRHPTAEGCRTPAEGIRALLETEPARLGLGDLDNVLDKALRKAPADRYPTAAAFADDLERYIRHEPVSARSHSLTYRVKKFTRRNRTAVLAGTVTAAGLIGATAFSVGQMREARFQRDAAVRESRRADAQVEFQNVLLSNVGDRPITMHEVLDAARGVLEGQAAGDPVIRTALLLQLAGSYRELGDTRIRETLLLRAESITVAGRDTVRLAQVRCDMADLRRKQGRYDEARLTLDRADLLARAARDPSTEAGCLYVRATLESELHRGNQALVAARRAVAIKDSLGETGNAGYLDLLGTLASALDEAGRSRESAAVFRRIMSTMDSTGLGGTLSRVITGHNLALTLVGLGETAEAERLFSTTLERFMHNDRSGRVSWQAGIHYAEAALTQGYTDSALKYFRVIAAQGVADTNLYWEGRGLFGLGRAQVRLGRLTEARQTRARLERIAAMFPGLRQTEDEVPDERVLGGWIALAEGDTATAQEQFMAALRAHGYYEGKNRHRLHSAVLAAAVCALGLRQTEEALRLAREARTTAAVDSPAEFRSARVGEARLIEARVLLAISDSGAARAALERARVALRTGAGAEDTRTREASALALELER